MRIATLIFLPFASLGLSACMVGTVVDVATAPVRGAIQVADWATTSQDEADRNRGRALRAREEELGQLQSEYNEQTDDCFDGRESACRDAMETRREIEALLPSVPVRPAD